MGRIVVTEFISLDGVIQAPGGSEDYKHAGWSFEIAAWPERDGEFADKFNSMPEYVVSSTLRDSQRTNSHRDRSR